METKLIGKVAIYPHYNPPHFKSTSIDTDKAAVEVILEKAQSRLEYLKGDLVGACSTRCEFATPAKILNRLPNKDNLAEIHRKMREKIQKDLQILKEIGAEYGVVIKERSAEYNFIVIIEG